MMQINGPRARSERHQDTGYNQRHDKGGGNDIRRAAGGFHHKPFAGRSESGATRLPRPLFGGKRHDNEQKVDNRTRFCQDTKGDFTRQKTKESGMKKSLNEKRDGFNRRELLNKAREMVNFIEQAHKSGLAAHDVEQALSAERP
jgi:hypothetical protein